jgi:hypothetical protein
VRTNIDIRLARWIRTQIPISKDLKPAISLLAKAALGLVSSVAHFQRAKIAENEF